MGEVAAQKSDEKKELSARSNTESSQVLPPSRQSLVGDKYSKKKSSVSAFTGPAYKLTK